MSQQDVRHSVSSSLSSLLTRHWRRGWFSAWPSADDGQSILYASFHLHPDDSDLAEAALRTAIASYGGQTSWSLIRHQINRFVLCPTVIAEEAGTGNLGKAALSIQSKMPDLERQAAVDLQLIIDHFDRTPSAKPMDTAL